MNVGFVGIGQMGRHMASRLVDAGFHVTVHDVYKDAAGDALAKGARWAESPRELAASCDVIFSSLPKPQDVSNVIYGDSGLAAGWKSGDIYVDMSTNSPSLIRKIAADAGGKGVTVLDAPVSGGVKGAEAGTLTIMVGGPEAALEKVRKPLEAMGKKIIRVGDAGGGNVAKLVNNLISLGCNSISAEGFALGVKGGLDPQVLWDIVSSSTGDNWCMRQFPNTTFKGNFEPGFRVELAYKDINLALELGDEYGVPLATAHTVREELRETIESGLGGKGVDAVILPIEKTTGVEVRTK